MRTLCYTLSVYDEGERKDNARHQMSKRLVFILRRFEFDDGEIDERTDAKYRYWWLDFFKRWLIPRYGCDEKMKFVNRIVSHPLEFISLDMSLFQDIKLSHNYHCAVTSDLPDNDERKFSMKTPETTVRGVKWLVEGVSCSDRIMQARDQVLNTMKIVCEHNDAIVPGLANRNGDRYSKEDTNDPEVDCVKCEELQECSWLQLLALNKLGSWVNVTVWQRVKLKKRLTTTMNM